MEITKHDGYLKDERRNTAYLNYFGSEDAARRALESLEGCDDCRNCSGCSDCSDCSRCSGCSDCSGCSGCSDCSRCSGCSDCSRCSGCSDCSRCSHVAYIADKEGLRGDPATQTAPRADLEIPKIENIHQTVLAAASQPCALNMGTWHCGTSHCRAGWVVTLAGEAGKALEAFHNTEMAAMLIYRENSPVKVFPWRFYQADDEAMADMQRCAEEEAASSAA